MNFDATVRLVGRGATVVICSDPTNALSLQGWVTDLSLYFCF